jgi:hypothetical protein
MSVHELTDASQKSTCPAVTGVEPALTVAVKVTTVPEAALVTWLLPEAIVSVVFVGAFDSAAAIFPAPQKSSDAIRHQAPTLREASDPKYGRKVGIEVPANSGLMIIAIPPDSSSARTHDSLCSLLQIGTISINRI